VNWYKASQENNNDNPEDSKYFRGVSKGEAMLALKGGLLSPSSDLIPFDNEVLEYAIGDEYSQMSQDAIDEWIRSVIPWYDGSLKSVKGGVNLTMDFDNAQGYGDYVLAINADDAEVADVSDSHAFARSPNGLKISGVYDAKRAQWLKRRMM